tara:strand:+ start:229 stop:411 length:183 start_codon:yes stop_codon:yes gene_type:complete
MTKNKVYPTQRNNNNSDVLYDLSVGISCAACLCIIICISIIVILHFSIEREEMSGSGLIL